MVAAEFLPLIATNWKSATFSEDHSLSGNYYYFLQPLPVVSAKAKKASEGLDIKHTARSNMFVLVI